MQESSSTKSKDKDRCKSSNDGEEELAQTTYRRFFANEQKIQEDAARIRLASRGQDSQELNKNRKEEQKVISMNVDELRRELLEARNQKSVKARDNGNAYAVLEKQNELATGVARDQETEEARRDSRNVTVGKDAGVSARLSTEVGLTNEGHFLMSSEHILKAAKPAQDKN